MESETVFRIIFGITLVAGMGIRVYFQKQAKGVERVASYHQRRERFLLNLLLSSYLLMLLYVFTPWLDFSHIPLPTWIRWIGALMICVGLGLFTWTHQVLGANWSGVLEISKGHRFVTEGPYRYVRHPMYGTMFWSAVGTLLLSANWFIGVSHLGAVLWIYLARVSSEEAMMIEHFGDDYRQYMTTTGRLLPRIHKRRFH